MLAMPGHAQPPVPGAHPANWWGLAPLSTEEPVVPDGEPGLVSPSRVEAVQKSPLDWFVQAAGGEAATDFARSLGTLVHAIAQDLPDASGTEYVAELVAPVAEPGNEGKLGRQSWTSNAPKPWSANSPSTSS